MKIFLAILCSLLLAAMPALATLTATVSPGYQFSANERPTTSTLNLLATPTITIFGTVDGSTGLTPGSVTGTMLADSVSDTSAGSAKATLSWYSFGGGRALQVADGGVSFLQLATNVAGRGLSGGVTTNLNVNLDNISLTLDTNNALKISDNYLAGIFYSYPATAGFTNTWGLTNAFAITNYAMLIPTNQWTYTTNVSGGTTNVTTNSTANTLADGDVLSIKSTLQRTNTTATLEALRSYLSPEHGMVKITNSQSWVVPARSVSVIMVGGGGGGAWFGPQTGSGGRGGYVEAVINNLPVNSAVALTVGLGATNLNAEATAPAGGTTSFGSYISVSGGNGAGWTGSGYTNGATGTLSNPNNYNHVTDVLVNNVTNVFGLGGQGSAGKGGYGVIYIKW
jgi:hypothetical protein